MFAVKLPPALIKRLRLQAAQQDTTLQVLVEALLEAGLKQLKRAG